MIPGLSGGSSSCLVSVHSWGGWGDRRGREPLPSTAVPGLGWMARGMGWAGRAMEWPDWGWLGVALTKRCDWWFPDVWLGTGTSDDVTVCWLFLPANGYSNTHTRFLKSTKAKVGMYQEIFEPCLLYRHEVWSMKICDRKRLEAV